MTRTLSSCHCLGESGVEKPTNPITLREPQVLCPNHNHHIHYPSHSFPFPDPRFLSGSPVKTILIALRKQALGVFILQRGMVIALSLLRLVGAENHSILHCTTQGIPKSYCIASNVLASCSITLSTDGTLSCRSYISVKYKVSPDPNSTRFRPGGKILLL